MLRTAVRLSPDVGHEKFFALGHVAPGAEGLMFLRRGVQLLEAAAVCVASPRFSSVSHTRVYPVCLPVVQRRRFAEGRAVRGAELARGGAPRRGGTTGGGFRRAAAARARGGARGGGGAVRAGVRRGPGRARAAVHARRARRRGGPRGRRAAAAARVVSEVARRGRWRQRAQRR